MRYLAALLLSVALTACASPAPTPSPTSTSTSSPSPAATLLLPTVAQWDGACRGIGLDATLAGDPSDPRIAWLTASGGQRIDITWPPGYTARFAPDLVVLDASGTIVFREGSTVSGGCTTGPDAKGPLLIVAGIRWGMSRSCADVLTATSDPWAVGAPLTLNGPGCS
jgi:hypothetical protein